MSSGGGGGGHNLGSVPSKHSPAAPPPHENPAGGGGGPHYHHSQLHSDHISGGGPRQQLQQSPPPRIHQNEYPPNNSWSRWQNTYRHPPPPPTSDHHPVVVPSENKQPELVRDSKGGADKDTSSSSSRAGVCSGNREWERVAAYHPEEHKEGYGAGMGHLNWKESKETYTGGNKRYTTADAGINLLGSTQEVPSIDPRENNDGHEAAGKDRHMEKDGKRKDLKHRDWGEREKDQKNNLLPGSGSGGERKEPVKEEREVDRWEQEKKDFPKDGDKVKEKEKDLVKREPWIGGPEKDVLNIDKKPMDISGVTPEQESSALDQKKQKDQADWKGVDTEAREKRKERDADVEPETPEKRSRCDRKESDDGFAGTERDAEKEREAFTYGVQQRKRMLRPRGSPQVGNREPRFRSQAQDQEGTQGKPEVSSVAYKPGECMQELMKLWKEYELSQADKNGESSQASPALEIRIPAEYITATNRQVRGGQLWGTDVYTNDSDLVAVLMHTGYCRPTAASPPPSIQELRASVRVLPPQDCYISTLRNNVRSRAWGAAIGCSYLVERCRILKKGGGAIDLEPCLTHTSAVEPTLAPVAVERTMTTRAAASNALRQQRFVREVTIQYNLCNEPWIKYSLSVVADKGLKQPLYTSARLKKGEVLYLETHSCRYELCFTGEKMVKAARSVQTHDTDIEKSQSYNLHSANGERERSGPVDGDDAIIDVFRWSRCKRPLPQTLLRSSGIPLPSDHLQVLEENLDWEDIQWSQTGVYVSGREYVLARVHFMSPN